MTATVSASIRFMPDAPGPWTYVTESNCEALNGQKGTFTCAEAAPGNHGPVRVKDTYHFAYADGDSILSVRYDLLCVDSPDSRVAAADAQDADERPIQQAADVRVSEELRLQQERAIALPV